MDNNEPPKIAVLLAAYNGMQWIEEQVETIFNQQGVVVTLFISVDLSSDATYEWAKKLEAKRSNVVLLSYGEYFGGAGPNFFRLIKCVDFTEFDAVSFADQDDIWMPEKLSSAYSKIKNGLYDIYSSNVTAFWADGRESLINKSQAQRKLDYFFEAAGPGCTYVFKQEVMLAFQNFITTKGNEIEKVALHDWLAYAFCREQGYQWFIDEWPSMRYRQHKNNQIGTNNSLAAYKKRIEFINNRWFKNQVNIIARLVAPSKLNKINNRFYLIVNFRSLRRRFRDKLFFLIILVVGIY